MGWRLIFPNLEVYEGRRRTSYRINLRVRGKRVRKLLTPERGEFKSLQQVKKVAEKIIADLRFGPKTPPPALVRCEEIAEQLLRESLEQDTATQESKRNTFRRHLIPWLNENCPYAGELSVETWKNYKIYKRSIKPTIALENHYKYFQMLANRAFEKRILPAKIRIPFSVKRDDFREEGRVISPEDEAKILAAANRVWRSRSIIQRDTGMRPGEVRNLRKERVTFNSDGTATVRLLEGDTKTHRRREFVVKSERAVATLKVQRDYYPDSPYFFASEKDHQKPMDKHQKGWRNALARAGIKTRYTPHDWRHTYATEMFKKLGLAGAGTLCYQLDMSLVTAQTVYLHLSSADTVHLADVVAAKRDEKNS